MPDFDDAAAHLRRKPLVYVAQKPLTPPPVDAEKEAAKDAAWAEVKAQERARIEALRSGLSAWRGVALLKAKFTDAERVPPSPREAPQPRTAPTPRKAPMARQAPAPRQAPAGRAIKDVSGDFTPIPRPATPDDPQP